jgi:hypothetical protein
MIFNFISCDNCMTSSINIMWYRENKCQVISVFQERFLISDVTQGELPCHIAALPKNLRSIAHGIRQDNSCFNFSPNINGNDELILGAA